MTDLLIKLIPLFPLLAVILKAKDHKRSGVAFDAGNPTREA